MLSTGASTPWRRFAWYCSCSWHGFAKGQNNIGATTLCSSQPPVQSADGGARGRGVPVEDLVDPGDEGASEGARGDTEPSRAGPAFLAPGRAGERGAPFG